MQPLREGLRDGDGPEERVENRGAKLSRAHGASRRERRHPKRDLHWWIVVEDPRDLPFEVRERGRDERVK